MTLDELSRHLLLGRQRAVVVDRRLVPELPRVVRTVVFRPGNTVELRFESYGYDEGGLHFEAQFETLERAVENVEAYLGRPLAEWENFTRTGNYPAAPSDERLPLSWAELQKALTPPSPLLPQDGYFERVK